MSPTHEKVSNLFTEKAAVYAQSRRIARKQTRVVTLAEQVPVEGTYEIEAHSEEIGFQQEITVDLGKPSKEKPLQTMVRSVEERVSEEITLEVQEVLGETSQEQQVFVELAQSTKEGAQPTAVEPVQEAISEESLFELSEVLEEVGSEKGRSI